MLADADTKTVRGDDDHLDETATDATTCGDDEHLELETLPADAVRCIFEILDAPSLAKVRACSINVKQLVDAIAADLLTRHMHECRQRATERCTFVPRGSEPSSFVGLVSSRGSICLKGGMCCGGSGMRRSLHEHMITSHAWKAASYCGRQVLLVRSDGALIGDGPGMRGADVMLVCACGADAHGSDGAAVDNDDVGPGLTPEEEALMREQEEEAASRGWAWRPKPQHVGLGLGSTALPIGAKLLALPEAAAAACACPGRSHVLGESGAVYSARWHGQLGCSGPSASPWGVWRPPSPALRVVEISALSAHVLLRTSNASAMSYGDPQEGKLGYLAPRAVYVSTPRVIDALAGHTIVGVAAGGRHSLFLTERGECLTAGANHAGQCGHVPTATGTAGSVRLMRLPAECAPLVQVSAGHAHTLLLSHTGHVYACGLNDQGQCGLEPEESDGACVLEPSLVSGLLPHTVRAVEAGPSLSVFEVEEAPSGVGDGEARRLLRLAASEGSEGAQKALEELTTLTNASTLEAIDNHALDCAPAADAPTPPLGAAESQCAQYQYEATPGMTLWLAGHVEAFNIPGTNAPAGGLRFLPSCYRWQLYSVT